MGVDGAFKAAIPGGLKLKGSGALGAAGGVKKKERSKEKALVVPPADAAGGAGSAPGAPVDKRTASERAFDERMAREELRSIAKGATQTHREKVAAFNAHLAKLSEHHDIPRVGPG
jgi:protein FAM32A